MTSETKKEDRVCIGCKQQAVYDDVFDHCKRCIDLYDAHVDPNWDKNTKPVSPDDDFYSFQGPQCPADDEVLEELLKKAGILKK